MSIFSDIANKLTSGKQKDEDSELEPMTSLSEQSPDEKRLVEYVKQKIDQVRQTNSRIAIEGVALTNISYLLGFDGVYYDTTYRQFKNIDPRRKLTRNRYKVNKILPTIQNRLSRLVQNSPKYDVRPRLILARIKTAQDLAFRSLTISWISKTSLRSSKTCS